MLLNLFQSEFPSYRSTSHNIKILNLRDIVLFCRIRFDVLMESKGGKKKSSSSSSLEYEAPLGYSIEDVRPAGGIKKFQSAAYSNVSASQIDQFIYVAFFLLV